MTTQTTTRPLYQIAADIRKAWAKPYFGAVPYLEAMGSLSSINDNYFDDSARSIVMYFFGQCQHLQG